ncbi:hypothetical protein MUK42_29883 [Musa troglodytarum]|uniref:Uncharacterized protein n=1 Tax=Musa troglodytarum TaxID=320322 RepID=A0A9E7FK90_9LILI|nr:hypothetical protein MUK42_29883 [Musa troglodytarum]
MRGVPFLFDGAIETQELHAQDGWATFHFRLAQRQTDRGPQRSPQVLNGSNGWTIRRRSFPDPWTRTMPSEPNGLPTDGDDAEAALHSSAFFFLVLPFVFLYSASPSRSKPSALPLPRMPL